MKKEKWEVNFHKLIERCLGNTPKRMEYHDRWVCQECGLGQGFIEEEIVKFISQLLTEERKAVIEEVEKRVKKTFWYGGSSAIDDVMKILEQLKN